MLYPATSYPTYEMGAILAGCRPVAVRDGRRARPRRDRTRRRRPRPGAVGQQPRQPDRRPRRPRRRRRRGVAATACRCSPTSATSSSRGTVPPAASSQHGLDGVVAVHSLSKRSNLAGGRVGFYAGDAELVRYLQEVRKHVGMMVPGPAQAAGVVALDDDEHVGRAAPALPAPARADGRGPRDVDRSVDRAAGRRVLPVVPVDDGWAYAERLADGGRSGGQPRRVLRRRASTDHVRVAVVQPDDRIEQVAARLGV